MKFELWFVNVQNCDRGRAKMAKNFMSNILDELMGRDRDALPTDKPRTYRWDDSAVSKACSNADGFLVLKSA